MVRGLLLAFALLAGAAAAQDAPPEPAIEEAAPPPLAGPAVILDGDTLILNDAGPRGGDVTVRLFSIDTPEMDAPFGPQARAALDDLVGAAIVTCTPIETDRFERTVATCTARTGDLGAALLRGGWATVYRTFTAGTEWADPYDAAERQARAAGDGLWADSGDAVA